MVSHQTHKDHTSVLNISSNFLMTKEDTFLRKSVDRDDTPPHSVPCVYSLAPSASFSSKFDMNSDNFDDSDSHMHKEATSVYLQSLVESSLWFELFFSKVGAVLNVFHLIVLTRKSMMTSSINFITIGIASCDLFLMLNVIRGSLVHVAPRGSDCTPPPSLFAMRFDWFLVSAHSGFRQCSAWLAVFISLIMHLIITDITNQNSKFSKPGYGYKTVLFVFLMSALMSFLNYFHHGFVETGTWRPKQTCEEYSPEWNAPIYEMKCIDLLQAYNGLLARIRLFFEGVVSKVVPCILLPILTGLLIYELKMTEKKFGNAAVSATRKEARKSQKYRTTCMVIIIAISFLLSEFPTGLLEVVEAIWHDDPVIERISKTVEFICDAIFTANSSLHCLVYFTMSLQYRKTVYRLLTCSKKNSNQVTAMQNITKITSSQQQ